MMQMSASVMMNTAIFWNKWIIKIFKRDLNLSDNGVCIVGSDFIVIYNAPVYFQKMYAGAFFE